MGVLAMAEGLDESTVVSVLAKAVPTEREPFCRSGFRGGLAGVDLPVGVGGDWVVVGRPVGDPWGTPLDAYPCADLAAQFDRYGPAAVQLAAGPFLALNVADGRFVRSLVGLIPAYVSTAGPWRVATSADLLAAMGSDGCRLVPPGACVSPDGHVDEFGPIAAAPGRCSLPWAWFQSQIIERLGRMGGTGMPPSYPDTWSLPSGDTVYVPDLAALAGTPDSLDRYREMRSCLHRLWWQTRRLDRWLFAPGFERPVLDTLSMLRDAREQS